MTINVRVRARAAFTLTELLIAMGIIAMLIGMMVPAANKVRQQAMRTECLSQMRSLSQAHTMYMTDNRGRFVPAGLPHGGVGDPRTSWMTILPGKYMALSSDALRSPVDRSPFWSVQDGGHWDGITLAEAVNTLGSDPDAAIPNDQISRWSSYGVNGWLANDQVLEGQTAWTRLSQIRNPASTVHFLIMTDGIQEDGGEPDFARTDHVDPWTWTGGPAKNHPYLRATEQMQLNAHGGRPRTWEGRAGYGFLDGSVATHKFSVVFQSATENRFNPAYSYRNDSFTN